MAGATNSPPRHFGTPLRTLAVGLRILRAGLRRKRTGPERYQGSAEEICEQIVRRNFDLRRRMFQTSLWSYPEFWARDFGRCVAPLLALGFEREVVETYRYALGCYERTGAFALVILPDGKLFDFPAGYAPDGFAFFLHGLARVGDRALVARYRAFLEHEAERFASQVVAPETGLVRRGVLFSEAQDNALRDSSCYSNAACFLARESLSALGLHNPLARFDLSAVVERFWEGDHYVDDMRRPPFASGDAQLLPFWCGAVEAQVAQARLGAVLRWMDREGLNDPLPSRYGTGPAIGRRMHLVHRINPWQVSAVWTCLGIHLLEVLRQHEHPRYPVELARYRRLVERERCFPEVLDGETGDLFEGPVLLSEDSMLWAANVWQMLREARLARLVEPPAPAPHPTGAPPT